MVRVLLWKLWHLMTRNGWTYYPIWIHYFGWFKLSFIFLTKKHFLLSEREFFFTSVSSFGSIPIISSIFIIMWGEDISKSSTKFANSFLIQRFQGQTNKLGREKKLRKTRDKPKLLSFTNLKIIRIASLDGMWYFSTQKNVLKDGKILLKFNICVVSKK